MKIFGWSLSGIIVAYIGIYIVLSFLGKHAPSHENAVGIPTRYSWQPKFVHLERNSKLGDAPELEANALGYAFLPLIYADRAVWHKDKSLGKGVVDEILDKDD